MNKIIKITLTAKDVQGDRTPSGQLIDKVAMALDKWTFEDLYESNLDYENDGVDYLLKEFDYESAYIEYLNGFNASGALEFLKFDYPDYKKGKLLLGAWTALNRPEFFASELSDYKEKLKEAIWSREEERAEEFAPGLWAKCEEAREEFWTTLRREWLFGDRSEPGLIRELERYLSAEDVRYNEKKDEMTIEMTEEAAREFCAEDESVKNEAFDEGTKEEKKNH